jgi:RimJ/RimL family protein N-acetyltransferase
MQITTERLILRDPKPSDATSLAENINDINVSRWLLVVPHPYKLKDAKWFIDHCAKGRKEKPRKAYDFSIELKSEKRVVGGISVMGINRYNGTAEVGYWLGCKHHGQGYGTEALRAVLDFAFKKLKLRRLEAGVFAGNPSSGKLLERFGFKLEGSKRKGKRSKADGKINDELLYGMLKEEYRPNAGKKS